MSYQYFSLSEFDSPDEPGSGRKMRAEFVRLLDKARHISGVPYVITSGYRTQNHLESLTAQGYPTSKTSAHLDGWAADIATPTNAIRYAVLRGLFSVGFNRVGIGRGFVHVDKHPLKIGRVVWTYDTK